MDLSIVIVNYKVEKELLICLASISEKIKGVKYEVIVVENDLGTDITQKIKKFKFVKYVRAFKNLGFGGGNNLGAKYASGKYLFFLNPDTEIEQGSIKSLLGEFSKKVGIVAPVLVDKNRKLFKLQGTQRITPVRAIFSLSIINKLWPGNPIAAKFWLKNVNRSKSYAVDVVPGTAFVIERRLFQDIGGFDERFFLYFEENDLCNRVKAEGYKIIMSPALRVMHLWGVSTSKSKNIQQIFENSRFYYLKKYYGVSAAVVTSFILNINTNSLLLMFVLFLGAVLRVYNLNTLMIFIQDQGWFYLSARDMLITGNIPLVGITSSQIWLHQGPLWTYMLAPFLFVSSFNPIGGAYLSILFDLGTILTLYIIGSIFFSKRVGIMAAVLYSFSPLVIILSRMPYHTSPIPFFSSLLILSMLFWVNGRVWFFPLVLFCLSTLYNFELASVIVWFLVAAIFLFGIIRKAGWVKGILNLKIIVVSVVALILPLIPILIYDLNHEFVQTLKFANWVVFLKIIKPVLTMELSQTNHLAVIQFVSGSVQPLLFLAGFKVGIALLGASLGVLAVRAFKRGYKNVSENLLLVIFLVLLFGTVFNGVASEAYLPILFPVVFLVIAYFLASIKSSVLGTILLIFIILSNIYLLLSNSYYSGKDKKYGPTLQQLKTETKTLSGKSKILNEANYKYIKWYESIKK